MVHGNKYNKDQIFSSIKTAPASSRKYNANFSLAVCLTIVFSCTMSFFGGFLLSAFTMKENYGSVYENLLSEIDESRSCLNRQRATLERIKTQHINFIKINKDAKSDESQTNNQAILDIFNGKLEVNTRIEACHELKNIILKKGLIVDELSDSTKLFLNQHCN